MSGARSDDDRADELTERYRTASAADPARPGDAVRDSVFAYARTVATDAATHDIARVAGRRPAANESSWRISAAASVIVAGLATLLAWRLHAPLRPAGQEPNPAPSQITEQNPAAPGYAVSAGSSEPAQVDRPASAAPAPNAVTTRSRERAGEAKAPGSAHDTAAELGTAEGVASSLQAPARLARSATAKNASSGESASDAESKLENRIAGGQVAPSAAAAPPNVQAPAPRYQAKNGAVSADTGVAANSALVRAAESGNLELVDQLLRSGASTEQTDARGRTALLVATLRGDLAMARRLLAAGAHADAVDDGGDTPLAAARRQGPPELARLLEGASHP